jgi:hypothetical protein
MELSCDTRQLASHIVGTPQLCINSQTSLTPIKSFNFEFGMYIAMKLPPDSPSSCRPIRRRRFLRVAGSRHWPLRRSIQLKITADVLAVLGSLKHSPGSFACSTMKARMLRKATVISGVFNAVVEVVLQIMNKEMTVTTNMSLDSVFF